MPKNKGGGGGGAKSGGGGAKGGKGAPKGGDGEGKQEAKGGTAVKVNLHVRDLKQHVKNRLKKKYKIF